ncbi:hypothetical protein C8T65DRAFT_703034 [Cerioporus squamosus]|nr:hypothetical protein C8T65DRAFT_703034 [Cerioporus squamosus]
MAVEPFSRLWEMGFGIAMVPGAMLGKATDTAPGNTRRYSTRRSTQVSRPGVAAGLAKRHKTDIQAVAAKKREGEAAKRDRKEKCMEAKAARERDAAKTLAGMLDERARRELEEEEDMERTPTLEDECDNTPARDAGSLSDKHAHADQQRPALDHEHIDDNRPPRVRCIEHAKSPPISLHSESSEDSTSSQSDSETLEDYPAVKTARRVGTSVAPPKKAVKDTPKSQKLTKAKATQRSVTQEDDDFEAVAPPKKKLTEAERKAARVQRLRAEIAECRQVVPSQGVAAVSGENPARDPSAWSTPSTTKGKGSGGDTFTADYRSRIRARTTAQTPVANHDSTTDATDLMFTFIGDHLASEPTTATPVQDDWLANTFNLIPSMRNPSTSSASAPRVPDPTPLSDEEIGGFNDEDVAALAPTRAQKRTMQVTRGPAKNTMVGILTDSLIEVVISPKKPARAPRRQVTILQSRSFLALASWIQATIISIIIPSLIKFYGARNHPWDLDGKSLNDFATIFKALLKRLHPGREESISKSDKEWRYIYLQARQAVYDWRSNFAKLAMQLVNKAMNALPTPTAISIWATNVLPKGGEATYSQPNLLDPTAARGALQTPLHIQLLAYHYNTAEGAIIEASYPVGALSLANVAIRRAFSVWKTGTSVAPEDFTEGKFGAATMQSRNGSVKGLENIPHRFDSLVAMAMAMLPSFKRAEAENAQEAADDKDAYAAVDPPTSPPAADQY